MHHLRFHDVICCNILYDHRNDRMVAFAVVGIVRAAGDLGMMLCD